MMKRREEIRELCAAFVGYIDDPQEFIEEQLSVSSDPWLRFCWAEQLINIVAQASDVLPDEVCDAIPDGLPGLSDQDIQYFTERLLRCFRMEEPMHNLTNSRIASKMNLIHRRS